MSETRKSETKPEIAAASRRLDQWLWFARLAKTRSLAARLCAQGAVAVNGTTIGKAGHAIRAGDAIGVRQGLRPRLVRVVALGTRRGPPPEARSLYEETAAAVGPEEPERWRPLLLDEIDDDGRG